MSKENFSLTYFLTRPFFFGIIYSQIFSLAESDSLISGFLGTFLGIIIIMILHHLKPSKTTEFLFYLFILVLAFSSIETYASSFLLNKTPKIIFIVPALLLVIYASYKTKQTIRRAAFIFMLISLCSTILIALLLGNYLNTKNILPFFIHDTNSIFQAAFIFAITSTMPNFLLRNENITLKKHLIYYFVTCLLMIFIGFLILCVLTPNVAKIYSYPEYMVLKRIRILEFIENIENISVLTWYLDYFFLIVLTLKKMQNIIKKRIVFLTILILTTFLTTIYISNDFAINIWLYKYSFLFMTLFLVSFIITSFISTLKRK